MIIRSLDDLRVYLDAVDAADAVSALLTRVPLGRDFTLRDQLADASDSVSANISEGYGQGTDRHFAHFLAIARGSCNEMRTHITVARGRGYVTESERLDIVRRYTSIGKRLTRLIQHLRKEDRKERH